jgi:maltose alpha-D-glucosyltransferase/alpha-amylase
MHGVLARATDDAAFTPQTATERDVARWAAGANDLLERAFEVLKKHTFEGETVEAEAKWLLSRQAHLTRETQCLARAGTGSAMTRIHGDFHLGQVLVASGDVYLIDFEGEPGRPLAERRAKASPLRDVAGLLRSFDYAAAATLDPKRITAARVPDAERIELVTRLRDGAKRAFLEAYRASGGSDSSDLLDLFLIEKAAYELVYEAANRPSWLTIPLQGLVELAARLAPSARKP